MRQVSESVPRLVAAERNVCLLPQRGFLKSGLSLLPPPEASLKAEVKPPPLDILSSVLITGWGVGLESAEVSGVRLVLRRPGRHMEGGLEMEGRLPADSHIPWRRGRALSRGEGLPRAQGT